MPRKNPTSVVLNESVQQVKDELSPIYGLKNILSAGLLIFSRLSAEEQKQFIAEVNNQLIDVEKIGRAAKRPVTLRDAIKEIVRKTKEKQEAETPRTIIKLGPTDKKLWNELTQILGPEPEKHKRKAKRG